MQPPKPVRILLLMAALGLPLIAQAPGDALEDGWAAFRTGQFEDAVSHFRRALATKSDNAEAHVGLVRSLLRKGSVEEARAAATAGLSALPEDPALLVAEAEVAYRRADFFQARQSAEAALKKDPALARGHLALGRLLMSESRYRSAREHLAEAFRLDPDDPEILLFYTYTLPDQEEEARLLGRYVALATNERRAHLQWLRAHLQLHDALGNLGRFDAGQPHQLKLHRLAMKAGDLSGFWLSVRINNKKSLRLLVDVGGGGITLKRGPAESARVERIADVPLPGLPKEKDRDAYWGKAQQLQIGSLKVDDALVHVADYHHLYFPGVDGIIGVGYFSGFRVTLDFQKDRMELAPYDDVSHSDSVLWDHDREAPPLGFHVVRRIGSSLLVPTRVNGREGFFAMSTAWRFNRLSLPMANQVSSASVANRIQKITGPGATSPLFAAKGIELVFAGLRQDMPEILADDLHEFSQSLGVEVSGVFGLEAIAQLTLTIDYRNGLVRFAYKR